MPIPYDAAFTSKSFEWVNHLVRSWESRVWTIRGGGLVIDADEERRVTVEEGRGRYRANQATDGAWWTAQVVNFLLATSVRLSICYTVYSLFSIRSLVKLHGH